MSSTNRRSIVTSVKERAGFVNYNYLKYEIFTNKKKALVIIASEIVVLS